MATTCTTFAAMCAAQAQRLTTFGATVHNTFIDIPADDSVHASARRRASSLPPRVRAEPCSATSPYEASATPSLIVPLKDSSQLLHLNGLLLPQSPRSTASTTCSSTEHQCLDLEAEPEPDAGVAAEELAQLVERECAFMRISGHSVQTSSTARKCAAACTLRFFVHGLPWAKRAKWLQPLLWSVSAVLARHGVEAGMKGGELVAITDSGAAVRIDFVAARW